MKKQGQKLTLNRETLLQLAGGREAPTGGLSFTCYFSCAVSCSPGGTTIDRPEEA